MNMAFARFRSRVHQAWIIAYAFTHRGHPCMALERNPTTRRPVPCNPVAALMAAQEAEEAKSLAWVMHRQSQRVQPK
jgi:hypothetical protein